MQNRDIDFAQHGLLIGLNRKKKKKKKEKKHFYWL